MLEDIFGTYGGADAEVVESYCRVCRGVGRC